MSEVTYTPKEECPYRYMDKCTPVLELEKIIAERDKETCEWKFIIMAAGYDAYKTSCGLCTPQVPTNFCHQCGKRVALKGGGG